MPSLASLLQDKYAEVCSMHRCLATMRSLDGEFQ